MPVVVELAPYACDPARSRGRLHPEPESAGRTAFQRDRDRIIHSAAFRRLKHKTQVFVHHEGDHYRTRLTHSLEVAQIARSVSRRLGLNEDLSEALALAHDLGHTPFGHAGEDALDAVMQPFGGFDHNVQSLRIVTALERKYAEFDGLNLTWETLEGVVKHNGPLIGERASGGVERIARALSPYDERHPLDLATFPSAEAQVASLCDDIAYSNHDVDDGLRAGLFDVADLDGIPIVGPAFAEVRRQYPGLEKQRLVHEAIRRMIDAMVSDLLAETVGRLEKARPSSAHDIRVLDRPVVAFSAEMARQNQTLKDFLMRRMYRHWRVNRMTSKARRVVKELFEQLHGEPRTLPDEWGAMADEAGTGRTARVVCDYIAGMTDRYALDEHFRLFDRYSKT